MIQPVTYDNGYYRRFGFKLGGNFHNGHDYNVSHGENVKSILDGEVVFASMLVQGFGGLNPSKAGGLVIIKYFDTYTAKTFYALYGHMQHFLKVGEKVFENQVIGTIDSFYNDGLFLPHLHFSISVQDKCPLPPYGYCNIERLAEYVDPLEFFRERGIRLC